MATNQNEGQIVISRIRGVEQRPSECDSNHALDCLNVEFQNGYMQRRKGRQILYDASLTTSVVKPNYVFYYDSSAGTMTDYTAALTDGDTSTAVITSLFSHAATSDALFIACSVKFGMVRFFFSSFASTNGTMTVTKPNWDGNTAHSLGFANFTGTNDGTAVGGFSFKQNGAFSWSLNSEYNSIASNTTTAWLPGLDKGLTSLPLPTYVNKYDFFWIRVAAGANVTGLNLAEISLSLQSIADVNQNFIGESQGMIEFTTRNLDRLLVANIDFPPLNDTNSQFVPYQYEARVFSIDMGRGAATALQLPSAFRNRAEPQKPVSFVVFNGWLLGSTTGGYLWRFDGSSTAALEPKIGLDLQNNVIGAQGYLKQTPRGTMLEVYRNRLMVAGDPTNPLGFYASLEDNSYLLIPPDAAVGGPNVWPLKYVFRVPGKEGDFIVGTSVVNDRYIIFTRSQIWMFDDVSLRNTNSDIGCISTRTIQRINNLIFFMSDEGFYATDGVNVEPLSMPLWSTLTTQINWRAICCNGAAISVYDRTRGEYKCWLPINGEWETQICVIYNIHTKSWRISAGWYPWDTNARRDANSVVQSISAACQARSSDGRQAVVTWDLDGHLWGEESGYDDNGKIYPSYVSFKPIASQGEFGETYINLREWYLTVDMTGQTFEGFQLGDGDRFDQEIDRRFAQAATKSLVATKQAILSAAVASEAQLTYNTVSSWPVATNYAKPKKIKLSFGRNLTKMQPVLHWAPGPFSTQTLSFGPNAATGFADSCAHDGLFVRKIQNNTGQSFALLQAHLIWVNTNQGGFYRFVIYADNSGVPGTLLAVSSDLTVVASQLNLQVDIPMPALLIANSANVWVGMQQGPLVGGLVPIFDRTNSNGYNTVANAAPFSSAAPASFPAGSAQTDGPTAWLTGGQYAYSTNPTPGRSCVYDLQIGANGKGDGR